MLLGSKFAKFNSLQGSNLTFFSIFHKNGIYSLLNDRIHFRIFTQKLVNFLLWWFTCYLGGQKNILPCWWSLYSIRCILTWTFRKSTLFYQKNKITGLMGKNKKKWFKKNCPKADIFFKNLFFYFLTTFLGVWQHFPTFFSLCNFWYHQYPPRY